MGKSMRSSFVITRLLPVLALPFLASSCAYLIPENTNTPRYNTVMGERHAPAENIASLQSAKESTVQSAPVAEIGEAPLAAVEPVATAPVTTAPDMAAALPPVDARTQAIASQRMQVAQNDPSLIDRVNPWNTPKDPNEKRMVPMENAPVNNGEYPTLSQVPPAPAMSGDESAAERLAKVRAELERERLKSEVVTTKTLNDAKADPSMLSPMPQPAPAPMVTPPAPAPAPINMDMPQTRAPSMNPPQAVNVPPMDSVRGTIAQLPPPPAPLAAAPSEITSRPLPPAAVPAASVAMQPIQLRQPAPSMPVEQPAYSMNTPSSAPVSMAPSANGSFDPMAGGAAAPIQLTPPSTKFATQAYLPPSRYAYRR